MRVDLQGSDGSSLLVMSDESLHRFACVADAYRWLQPFAADPANVSTLRHALAGHVSPVFVSRLSRDEVVRAVARAIARTCVVVDLPHLPPMSPEAEHAHRDLESDPAAADLTTLAEDEGTYDETRPEPVLPPEFPRLARREADQIEYRTRVMGSQLDLLRFVGERLTPTSKVSAALAATAAGHARAVEERAGDLGGRLAEWMTGGLPPIEASPRGAALSQTASRVAAAVVDIADRTGDLLSALLVGPADAIGASLVASSAREAAAARGRRLAAEVEDARAALERLVSRPDVEPARPSAISPIYAAVAAEQARVLDRIGGLDPDIERLLASPIPRPRPPRPTPEPGEPIPPAAARFDGLCIVAVPPGVDATYTPPADAEPLAAAIVGVPLALVACTHGAAPGTRVVFSVRIGANGFVEDLIGVVPGEVDGAAPADAVTPAPIRLAVRWVVPPLPPGTPIWFECRFLVGAAVGASEPVPVLSAFAFSDSEGALASARPAASTSTPATAPQPILVSSDTPVEVQGPRWRSPTDALQPIAMVPAMRDVPVLLVVDARGAAEGTLVSIEILGVDGPLAELSGAVEGGAARVAWRTPSLPPGELVAVARVHGSEPVRGAPLPVRAPFPFGDAAPSTSRAAVVAFPTPPPAELPPSTPHPDLRAPRWTAVDDPLAAVSTAPADTAVALRLRVEAPGVPSGTPVDFVVVGDATGAPAATATAVVEQGGAHADVVLPPGPASTLRFRVVAAGVAGHALSGPLFRLPAFPMGDGRPAVGPGTRLSAEPGEPTPPIVGVAGARPISVGPRWSRLDDALADLHHHPAGAPLAAVLHLEAPGVDDGAAVRFVVDGVEPPIERVAPVVQGRAQVVIEHPGPATGCLRPTASIADRALPGDPLWVVPSFPFGDISSPRPVTTLIPHAPPARPTFGAAGGGEPALHAPRWRRADEPTEPLAAVPSDATTAVELWADTPDHADGTPVRFIVRGEPSGLEHPDTPSAVTRHGVARARWRVAGPVDDAALRLFATAPGLEAPVPGAALRVLPPFDFGA